MITGLSVGVFGGGSIIFKEVISHFLKTTTTSGAFLQLGIISMVLIVVGAMFTNNPEGFVKKLLFKGLMIIQQAK